MTSVNLHKSIEQYKSTFTGRFSKAPKGWRKGGVEKLTNTLYGCKARLINIMVREINAESPIKHCVLERLKVHVLDPYTLMLIRLAQYSTVPGTIRRKGLSDWLQNYRSRHIVVKCGVFCTNNFRRSWNFVWKGSDWEHLKKAFDYDATSVFPAGTPF